MVEVRNSCPSLLDNVTPPSVVGNMSLKINFTRGLFEFDLTSNDASEVTLLILPGI